MPEPRHFESAPTPDGAGDNVSQAEALLVEGLDRYFSGRYADAIHIWTRVLFLDRSHARARAYIERARTAIAERQRRAEELLQASHDLLERGEVDSARNLLIQVVAEAGDDVHAEALRVKLERVERAHAGVDRGQPQTVRAPEAIPAWKAPRRSRAFAIVGTALAAGLVLAAVLTSPVLRTWMARGAEGDVAVVAPELGTGPVLSSSEVALVRARNLYNRGRLAEALRALDRITADSPVRAEGDALRVDIQRLLLSSAQERSRPQGDGRR